MKTTTTKLNREQTEMINDIITTDAIYYIICAHRKFGKTSMAVQLMLYYALNFPNSKLMFTSSTHFQIRKVYKEFICRMKDTGIIDRHNSAENSVIFINGSELFFKSVQLPDNLRGYSIDFLFMDDAAMYNNSTFQEILRPMLTVQGKKCFMFSTPKGKNWFYEIFNKSREDKRYKLYRCSSDDNQYTNQLEIEDARKSLPDELFRQEYLAEFVDFLDKNN